LVGAGIHKNGKVWIFYNGNFMNQLIVDNAEKQLERKTNWGLLGHPPLEGISPDLALRRLSREIGKGIPSPIGNLPKNANQNEW
jgi:hypothetical protein